MWNHIHPIHINQNWSPVVLLATNVRDPQQGHEWQCNFSGGKSFPPLFGMNSLLPNWQGSQKSIERHIEHFWPHDLDLWPMTLTYGPDLDILPLDLHAKIQVCMSVRLARIARRTNGHTDTRCQNCYTHHVRDVGCNKHGKMRWLSYSYSAWDSGARCSFSYH